MFFIVFSNWTSLSCRSGAVVKGGMERNNNVVNNNVGEFDPDEGPFEMVANDSPELRSPDQNSDSNDGPRTQSVMLY